MVGGEGLWKWWEERVCKSGGRRGSAYCRCQNVPLTITDMFVINHKENASLIKHKIVCD